jgi:hypothetical protein
MRALKGHLLPTEAYDGRESRDSHNYSQTTVRLPVYPSLVVDDSLPALNVSGTPWHRKPRQARFAAGSVGDVGV